MGEQKVKTRAVKKNVNPQWSDDLTLIIGNPNLPIRLSVYDRDKLSRDDKMGDAEFNIGPLLEATRTSLVDNPSDNIISSVYPCMKNCLADMSNITWDNGRVVQNMVLRLRNVERGFVELKLEWHGRENLDLLKIHVHKGVNLAKRDFFSRSSDPYVIVEMGAYKVKTPVVKKNVNPEWNTDFTLVIEDPNLPIRLSVYDRDKLSRDDKMGDAEFNIGPLLEATRTSLVDNPSDNIISSVYPCMKNCLADVSNITWDNGRVVQNMVLRLCNVERGFVELKLEIDMGVQTRFGES